MSKWSECAHTSGVCVCSGNEWRIRARDHFRSFPAQTNAPFTRGVGVNASRWLWMEWRQALPNWIVGPSHRFTGAARGRSWKLFNFSSANGGVSQSDRLMQIPNPVHATPEKYVIGCCNYDGASAPRFRHALRQALTPTPRVNAAWARARTHTSHTGCVCALRLLGHGCVQEVKKLYKYCSFSHTNRSFRVLGHQCVVTMGNCLIWISLCMFFFPLIETVTYTCHYMTDRLERIDLKTSKLDLLKKKRHLHLGCPWGKLIDTKF